MHILEVPKHLFLFNTIVTGDNKRHGDWTFTRPLNYTNVKLERTNPLTGLQFHYAHFYQAGSGRMHRTYVKHGLDFVGLTI